MDIIKDRKLRGDNTRAEHVEMDLGKVIGNSMIRACASLVKGNFL